MEKPVMPPARVLEDLLRKVRDEAGGHLSDAAAHAKVSFILLGLERYAEAAEEARAALRTYPENARLLGILGLALDAQGETDEGVTLLERAFELSRDNEHLLAAASCLRCRGRFEEAEDLLNVAILNQPDPRAYALLGEVCMARRRHKDAADNFLQSLELDPDDKDVGSNYADALLGHGMAPEALLACEELLEEYPTFARASFIKARCLVELGEVWEGLESYREALAWETEDDQRAIYFYCFGEMLAVAEFYDEAAGAFERAYTLAPEMAQAYIARAELMTEVFGTDDAILILSLGHDNCPHDTKIAVAYAKLLHGDERPQEALKVLRAAVPKDRGEADAKAEALADVLTGEGWWQDAVKELLDHARYVNGIGGDGGRFLAADEKDFEEYALSAARAYQEEPQDVKAGARLSCVLYCFRMLDGIYFFLEEFDELLLSDEAWGEPFISKSRRSLARRRSKFAQGIERLVSEFGGRVVPA